MTGRARTAGCPGRGCQVPRITTANWLLWNERDRATFSHPRVSGLYLTGRGRIKCQFGWKGKKQNKTNNNKQSENLSLSRGESALSALQTVPTHGAGRHRQPWWQEGIEGFIPLTTHSLDSGYLFWFVSNTGDWEEMKDGGSFSPSYCSAWYSLHHHPHPLVSLIATTDFHTQQYWGKKIPEKGDGTAKRDNR